MFLIFALSVQVLFCSTFIPQVSTGNLEYFLNSLFLGVFVYDLWGYGASELSVFTSLASRWNTSGFLDTSSKVITCSSYHYLGGSGLQGSAGYMQALYTGFTTHDIIYFALTLCLSGTWQSSDTFSIEIDNKGKNTFNIGAYATLHRSGTYGSSSIPYFITALVGKVFHTSSNVTIKLEWNFQGSGTPVPGLGTKDVSMSFGTKTVDDAEGIYVTIQDSSITQTTQCSSGSYLKQPGNVCTGCSSCNACYGPLKSQCYRPNFNWSYNGTVIFQCTSPCRACWGTANNQCYVCDTSTVLDQSNTCQSGCTYPYISSSTSYPKGCILPCSSDHFILWNYTCTSSCDLPLVKATTSGVSICQYPCSLSSNSYLYWNGSCLPTCPYYSRNESGYLFCDACQPGDYMYDNTSCFSFCYAHFNKKTIGGSKFCTYPCNNSSPFLYQDGTCLSSCTNTCIKSIEGNYHFCSNCSATVTSSISLPIKTLSTSLQVINGITKIFSGVMSAVNSANPATIFMSVLSDMLIYLRYLEINYPSKLQYVLDNEDAFSINVIPAMPDQLSAKFTTYNLPGKFGQYQLSSSFAVNFWQSGLSILITIIVLVFSGLFELITKKCGKLQSIFRRIKETLKWNFTLLLLVSHFDEVTFFSSFEFRTYRAASTWQNLSFALAALMNLTLIIIVTKMVVVIRSLRKRQINRVVAVSTINNVPSANEQYNYKDYKLLFEPFKENTILQQLFMPILILRICIFYAIIAYPYNYPLTQTIFILLLNISILLYLMLVRPHKNKLELGENIVQEGVVLIINICILILAALDHNGVKAEKTRENIGTLIIAVNTGFSSVGSIYMLLKFAVQIINLIRDFRQKAKSRATPIIHNRHVANVDTQHLEMSNYQEASQVALKDNNSCVHIQYPQENVSFSQGVAPCEHTAFTPAPQHHITYLQREMLNIQEMPPLSQKIQQGPIHIENESVIYRNETFQASKLKTLDRSVRRRDRLRRMNESKE